MYDLERAPDELHDVVHDPAYGERRKSLSAEADEWWHAHSDSIPSRRALYVTISG